MNNTIILNFANHIGRYRQMQDRLKQSLDKVGYTGHIAFYNHEEHIDLKCPYHKSEDLKLIADGKVVPYAFKAWAIYNALMIGRYENIIWMDSAVYASKDITPLIEATEREGYLLFDNIGFSIGDYTSDSCLEKLGMSREESFKKPMLMACLMSFNTKNEQAVGFIKRYMAAAQDGISFHGSWHNTNGEVSSDMRVKGHRHDQSAASIIVDQMGMKITNAQNTFFAYESHKGVVPVAPSVCLWSAGM